MKHWMRSITLSSVLLTVVAMAVSISEANAQSVEGEQPAAQPVDRRFQTNFDRRHDRGGFVRVDFGLGWVDRTSAREATESVRTSGIGVLPSVSAGAMPWAKTAVHGGIWGMIGRGLVTVGAGPGMTYYFNETGNLWLSAELGPVTSSHNSRLFSEWGLGGELGIGLFGWTGDRWSMGGSLFGGGEAFDLDANGREIRSWRLGLRFGVAYN